MWLDSGLLAFLQTCQPPARNVQSENPLRGERAALVYSIFLSVKQSSCSCISFPIPQPRRRPGNKDYEFYTQPDSVTELLESAWSADSGQCIGKAGEAASEAPSSRDHLHTTSRVPCNKHHRAIGSSLGSI